MSTQEEQQEKARMIELFDVLFLTWQLTGKDADISSIKQSLADCFIKRNIQIGHLLDNSSASSNNLLSNLTEQGVESLWRIIIDALNDETLNTNKMDAALNAWCDDKSKNIMDSAAEQHAAHPLGLGLLLADGRALDAKTALCTDVDITTALGASLTPSYQISAAGTYVGSPTNIADEIPEKINEYVDKIGASYPAPPTVKVSIPVADACHWRLLTLTFTDGQLTEVELWNSLGPDHASTGAYTAVQKAIRQKVQGVVNFKATGPQRGEITQTKPFSCGDLVVKEAFRRLKQKNLITQAPNEDSLREAMLVANAPGRALAGAATTLAPIDEEKREAIHDALKEPRHKAKQEAFDQMLAQHLQEDKSEDDGAFVRAFDKAYQESPQVQKLIETEKDPSPLTNVGPFFPPTDHTQKKEDSTKRTPPVTTLRAG